MVSEKQTMICRILQEFKIPLLVLKNKTLDRKIQTEWKNLAVTKIIKLIGQSSKKILP